MKTTLIKFSTTLLSIIMFTFTSNSHALIDPTSATVLLQKSCTDTTGSIDNCFTDLNTLNAWIESTRMPSAANPLFVDIGPGTFEGQYSCYNPPYEPGSYGGYVSLRGAGKGITTITKTAYPISTVACVSLNFSDMTVLSTGFTVQGAGSQTTWHDVEIKTTSGFYAWFDSSGNGCYAPPGTHHWFSSQIISEGSNTTAYQSSCDASWFFGSEITATSNTTGGSATAIKIGALANRKRAEIHVYGSVLRALATESSDATLTVVNALKKAEVHIHGTGIDAVGSNGNAIIALQSSGNAVIHASESSYSLNNGTGLSITRISNSGGSVLAPYLWQQQDSPPLISSQNHSDMVVVPDVDGLPQLLIYSTACTSKWFDVSNKLCRP